MGVCRIVNNYQVGCFAGEKTLIGYGYDRFKLENSGVIHIFEGLFKATIRRTDNIFQDKSKKFAFEQHDTTEGNRVIETKIKTEFLRR